MPGGLLTEGITIYFKGDTSSFGNSTKQAQGMLSGFASTMGPVGTALVAIGTAAVGVGIAATKMAADYQQSMLKVQALTGASTDQMKQFDSGLKSLAMDTGVAPKQLSEGLYNVISAGYKGADAMTVLSLATKDSVIGMTDAKVTTDALTNVLASFGMGAKDANRVNGEMLDTVTLGKSTFEQYANSIVKSASSANQFHESMETMNAAFATMTSSGIKAAQASTDFQASLKVMDGNIGAVAKSLDKNGIAFDQAKFNAMDYGHKIIYLNSALDEANAKHVHITGVTLQAAQAISTIAGHIDTYNSDLTTLSDKQAMAAKTQEAWGVTVQGFNVSMDRLKATASVAMIDLGQKLLPVATLGVNMLSYAFSNLMNMGGKASESLKSFGASLDHIGIKGAIANFEYLKKQLGDVFNTVGTFGAYAFNQLMPPMMKASDLSAKVSTDIRKLGDWFWNTGVKVRNFENSLLGSGPAVENIIDGVKKGEKTFAQFGASLAQLGPPLKNIGNLLVGELGKEFRYIGQDVKQLGGFFMTSVVPALKQAEPGFASLGKVMLNNVIPAMLQIRGVFADVIQHAFVVFAPIVEKIIPPLILLSGIIANGLAGAIKFLTPYVLQAAKAIGGFAEDIMDRVAPIITNVINGITPILQNLFSFWSTIWPEMSLVLQGVWNVIVGVIKIAWAIVTGIFKIALDLIGGKWDMVWKDMHDMLGGIWDGIVTAVGGGLEAIAGVLLGVGQIVYTYLVQPFLGALGQIGGVFSAIGKLISDASTMNWGAIPGDLSSLGVPGFASGVDNFQGGMALVGEKGPELAVFPRGTNILSNSKTSAVMSAAKSSAQYPSGLGGGTPPVIHVHVHNSPAPVMIDGHELTSRMAPHMANMIRLKGGVRSR